MTALVHPFIKLCLLKLNPQDLPHSRTLMAMALIGYWLISVLLATPFYGGEKALLHAAVEVVILAGYTQLLLTLSARSERFTQTLSALAGCSLLWGIVSLPLGYWLVQAPADQPPPVPALLYFGLILWLLAIYGHIFRHALSRGALIGFLAGFGFLVSASIASSLLFDTVSS